MSLRSAHLAGASVLTLSVAAVHIWKDMDESGNVKADTALRRTGAENMQLLQRRSRTTDMLRGTCRGTRVKEDRWRRFQRRREDGDVKLHQHQLHLFPVAASFWKAETVTLELYRRAELTDAGGTGSVFSGADIATGGKKKKRGRRLRRRRTDTD